jgi:two-component system response regulator DegU
MKLRIVVADDNPECLRKLKSVLGSNFEIVAAATDGNSALEAIREFKPDVAVLDLQMPGMNGIEVTRESTKDGQNTAFIICSVHQDQQFVQAAVDAGALGYVCKSDMFGNLVAAVEAVASGRTWCQTRVNFSRPPRSR